jgi:hypothetical protein
MIAQPPQHGAGSHDRSTETDRHSFRLLLWVGCGIIDVLLVAGLVWWLVD